MTKATQIKFPRVPRSPIDREYARQKTKVANQWCKHLETETVLVNHFDYANDEVYEVEHTQCVKCKREIKYI